MTSLAAKSDTAHPAFSWVRSQHIESLNISVEEYRHNKTGAVHYHIASSQPENVFLVAFRTVPMDDTGVAHILEHTALCGSKHFPVRDPFFMMIRRSLNTFMNAFTSSDWTAYPFASQNRKDFNNLLDVYLDAVFYSRLHPLDFAQEGHRVEFETPDDPNTPLVFKGVVFNEMKGAMSSPVSTLWQTLTHHLFPTTTYHYNSGGEPARIPDLSYEQLKAFYQSHYHPSNAVFMTFGDIPAAEHQQRFEEKALHDFEALDSHIHVDDEQRYQQPLVVEDVYALDEEDTKDKTHIVMGWLLGKSTSLEEMLQAHLLSSVLLDNSASPLRHALESTELGTAPSPLCGLEDSNREMSFMCGLEGSNPEHAQALEQLVLDVLEDVAQNGVPQDQVEAVLHQLELSQREIGGDGYPYGLQLILAGLSASIHGGDPVAVLNLDPVLEKLREDIKDPGFIKSLVQNLLINNQHRVRLTMKPDTGLSQRKDEIETQRLADMKAQLSDEQKQQIIDQAKQLEERQNQKDDEDILPKVGLKDVPSELRIPQGREQQIKTQKASLFETGTNGLVYQQLILDMPTLEEHQLDQLGNYSYCMTELGVGDKNYRDVQAWQSSISGGVSAYSSFRSAIDDVQSASGHMIISSKALTRNHEKFNQLMEQTFHQARFDELPRIRELMAQKRARKEQSITGQGHSLAMMAASSGMCPTAALNHRMSGLASVKHIKQLDDSLADAASLEKLAQDFQQIHDKLLTATRQHLLIAEADALPMLEKDIETYWCGSESVAQADLTLPQIHQQVKQAWVTSTQVNFCAKAYKTVPVEHPDAAALTVLGGFLRNGFLHRTIREQGGAYGGGASHEAGTASFRFYSYRDPRLVDTLSDFDRAIEWLVNESHQASQLEQAILGVIGQMDKPGSPAGEAKQAFHNQLYGRTPEQRQGYRERILGVTLDDLKRVGETYLVPERASVAVITSNANESLVSDQGLEIIRL